MADFTIRRKAYQRYSTREDNGFCRLGDVKDLFADTVTVSGVTTMTGNVTLGGSVAVDTISEATSATGVTVDGVLIKDNALTGKYEAIAEAATEVLVAADSNKTFFVDAATSAANYTLPTPVAGLRYKFIWVANCDNAVTITTADTTDTTGDMLRGGLLICAAAAVNTFVEAASDVNKATFDDNVENGAAGIGSWVEIICAEDAVWYITGVINSTTDADGVGSAIFSDVD